MGRRRLLAGAVLFLVVAGVVASVATSRRTDPSGGPRPDVDVRASAAHARQACTSVALAVLDVSRNASGQRVLSRLEDAHRDSHAAARSDAQWTQLDSGVQALLTSVRRDDPQLADVGLRVVRTVCEHLGVPV